MHFCLSTFLCISESHLLVIVNNTITQMGTQILCYSPYFQFFHGLSRSKTYRSNGSSMFNILRNHHIVFHRGCRILQSPPPMYKSSIYFFTFILTPAFFSFLFYIIHGRIDKCKVVSRCVLSGIHLILKILIIIMFSDSLCLFGEMSI